MNDKRLTNKDGLAYDVATPYIATYIGWELTKQGGPEKTHDYERLVRANQPTYPAVWAFATRMREGEPNEVTLEDKF